MPRTIPFIWILGAATMAMMSVAACDHSYNLGNLGGTGGAVATTGQGGGMGPGATGGGPGGGAGGAMPAGGGAGATGAGTGGGGAGGTAGSGAGGTNGTGGQGPTGTGGAKGSGGASGTGGTPGAGAGGGGGRGTGGTTGVGGAGLPGTGGAPAAAGGASGAGTGGRIGTGGVIGVGGSVGTGGSSGMGGAAGSAGGAATDACGSTCGPHTFCNQVLAQCLNSDPEWIPIPGGTFTMGRDLGFSPPYTGPAHQVTVPSFEMLRTEVTVAQYRACVTAGACATPADLTQDSRNNWGRAGFDYHPLNGVSPAQARIYCAWAGGGGLPSEAEFEYADSNGGQGVYAWNFGGINTSMDCVHAVLGFANPYGCGTGATWEVCSKPLGDNSQGLCDLTGNLSEWMEDDFALYDGNGDGIIDTPTDGSAYHSPTPKPNDNVIKGGSFLDSSVAGGNEVIDEVASYQRTNDVQQFPALYYVGFRCARPSTSP